jgi:hypothetical protein
MNKEIESEYIRNNFRPDDRVAVVLLKKSGAKPLRSERDDCGAGGV